MCYIYVMLYTYRLIVCLIVFFYWKQSRIVSNNYYYYYWIVNLSVEFCEFCVHIFWAFLVVYVWYIYLLGIYIYVHNFCIFLVGWTFYHNKMSLFSVKKCLCHRLSACGGRGSISGLLILLHLSVHPRLNSTSLKPFLLLLFLYLEQVSAWEILSSYIRPFLLLWASAYISRNNVSFANLM